MNLLLWVFDIMAPAAFMSSMVHRSELRSDKTGVLFDRKHVGRLAKLCLDPECNPPWHVHFI